MLGTTPKSDSQSTLATLTTACSSSGSMDGADNEVGSLPVVGEMYLSVYGPCIIIENSHGHNNDTIVAALWRIPFKSIASSSRLYFTASNASTILIKPLLTVPGMTVSVSVSVSQKQEQDTGRNSTQ